jgi:hypothetical protein
MTTLKDIRFGIELETVGLSIERCVSVIAAAIPGSRGSYDKVRLADGRNWSCVRDGSLTPGQSCEVVSPILTYADMDMLQNIIRALREAGARADDSCGIHVHVDGSVLDARSMANLVKSYNKQEDLLVKALAVRSNRRRYCNAVDQAFLGRLERRAVRSLDDVRTAWYGRREMHVSRYDVSRYHGLNLNSFFYRGTVEFRLFNGSMHAGEVKAYVNLCLAMVAKATQIKSTPSSKRESTDETAKYDMRMFLVSLGFIGDEFESTRLHLLKHLKGSGAHRNTTRNPEPRVTPPGMRWVFGRLIPVAGQEATQA